MAVMSLTKISRQLADILELSREDYQSNTWAGPSKSASNTNTSDGPSYLRKQTLNGRLTALEAEIGSIDNQIKELKDIRNNLIQEKGVVEKQLLEVGLPQNGRNGARGERKGKGVARQDGVDYTLEFDWSHELKVRMKKVFGIDNFRLCQQGLFPFIGCYSLRHFNALLILQSLQCEHGRA